MAMSAGVPASVRSAGARSRRVRLRAATGTTALLAAAVLAGCTAGPGPSSPHASSSAADDPKPPGPTATPSAGSTAAAPHASAPHTSPDAPTARDGRDYRACADGSCQVLVDAPAAIPVGGRTLHASVVDGTVHLAESAAGTRTTMTLGGPGGHGRLQTNGATVDVTVHRLTHDAAVLDISAN